MENKEHMLDEIVVKSTKIKMVMKGELVVMNMPGADCKRYTPVPDLNKFLHVELIFE